MHLAFRKDYYDENSILVVSDHGLQPDTKYSRVAMAWLKYLEEVENITIHSAWNGRELKVGQYRLDGWAEVTNASLTTYPHITSGKVAFEFYG